MTIDVIYAKNKAEAVEAIEMRSAKIVDLDYEGGGADIIELSRLGRKYIVGVSFRAQELISAKNVEALSEVVSTKSTFRTRFIECDFDISDNELSEYQKQASRYGDLIIPRGLLPSSYTTLE